MTWNNEKLREKMRQRRAVKTSSDPQDTSFVSWQEVDSALLEEALDHVCTAGGCLRLGTSRDRKTYAIGFYLGDVYFTEYYRNEKELNEFMGHILEVIKMALTQESEALKKASK